MVDILHRVGVQSKSLDDVYDALTTIEGLAGWWATDTTGDPAVGGVITFRFKPGTIAIRVKELQPAKQVLWEVVDGAEEWIGTTIGFELKEEDDFVIVLFEHKGWREPVEFMNHCSTKWAVFLLSLKQFVETGTGQPEPRDIQISNWH